MRSLIWVLKNEEGFYSIEESGKGFPQMSRRKHKQKDSLGEWLDCIENWKWVDNLGISVVSWVNKWD